MKVSQLIKALQNNNHPDDEIIALWWEKKDFQYPEDDEMTLTDEAWNKISDEFDSWHTAGEEVTEWIHSGVIDWSQEK